MAVTEYKVGGAGALMLKLYELIGVSVAAPAVPVKLMLAPVTAPKLVGTRPVKMIGFVPDTVLPEAVHDAPPTPLTGLATIVAEPDAGLPYKSVRSTTTLGVIMLPLAVFVG